MNDLQDTHLAPSAPTAIQSTSSSSESARDVTRLGTFSKRARFAFPSGSTFATPDCSDIAQGMSHEHAKKLFFCHGPISSESQSVCVPDAPARRGGNLSKSCTQFPLETVMQLSKEAGVVVAAAASASASGKPSEAAAADADNLDLATIPATFDYEGDETAWQQGLPPGEVGPQLSELELSDSDSSGASILGVCLDGFDGDAWMSEADGPHDDMQVGAAAGVNDPGDIPWRTTAWSAGADVVASARGAKKVGASPRRSSSALRGNTVTFNMQGAALGEKDDGEERVGRGSSVGRHRVADAGVPLTPAEKKENRRQENQTKRATKKLSPSKRHHHGQQVVSQDEKARTARHLDVLSRM